MQVKPATPNHAPGIARVHVASWQAGYRGILADDVLDALDKEERTLTWIRYLTDPDNEINTLVAEDDGGVAGFVSLIGVSRDEDAPPGVAEIPALYVDPPRWRTGVGRALMEVALAALVAAGANEVTVWVLEANERGRAFYAAAGFKPDGARDEVGESGAPEIRLARTLGPTEPQELI